jgi:hypothetical protein
MREHRGLDREGHRMITMPTGVTEEVYIER